MIGEQSAGEKARDAEAVDDPALEDHAEAILEGDPNALGDLLGIGLEGGDPLVAPRQEEVAGVVERVEARMEEEEGFEVMATEAGFFEDFASGGLGGGFIVLDAASGDLPGDVVDEEPVLPDQEDAVGVHDDQPGPGADFGDEILLGKALEGDADTMNLLVGVLVVELARPDARRDHARDRVTRDGAGLRKNKTPPSPGGRDWAAARPRRGGYWVLMRQKLAGADRWAASLSVSVVLAPVAVPVATSDQAEPDRLALY